VLLTWAPLSAQDLPQKPPDTALLSPVLQNTGKPIQTPFHCTGQDMQWAGMSCTAEEPCPVYLELSAVEAAGNKLFVAGDIHSQTVTLYSILIGSDDLGRTWQEVHPRIRGAGLDHVQFIDLENGWVSGEALSPLPQDPFLLLTDDGGKSWRQQPIFSETRVGSIQQMQFRSKNEGSLVMDRGQGSETERFELYESLNGGQSWTIKEASRRPIALKDVPSSPALWRVQADGPSQSYRIEHQQGGRWTVASQFAVSLEPCRPEPPAAEPSPDAPPPAPDSLRSPKK